MNNNNFLKIFSIIAFIAFMLVSCWATVESLCMSDPLGMKIKYPQIPYWVVTIGLFVISSIGATLVANSFNRRIRIENRGGKLIGGIFLLLIFWLLFSMPTNTHTFFFGNKGENVLIPMDISTTEKYLQQLTTVQDDQVDALKTNCEGEISSAFENFITEYNNKAMPGYGPKATKRLDTLNKILAKYNVVGLADKAGNHNDPRVRREITRQYRDEINLKIEQAKKNIGQKRKAELLGAKEQAKHALNELDRAEKLFSDYKVNKLTLTPKELNDLIVKPIQEGYSVIAIHPNHISFANDYDKQLYSGMKNDKGDNVKNDKGDNVANECESARLFNAFSVWQDYFNGKFKGMGFFYWIMLAMLVDIGGFIFFTIAFRKTE